MNIKALAEKIKKIEEHGKNNSVRWVDSTEYLLATALLRVLEDRSRLKRIAEKSLEGAEKGIWPLQNSGQHAAFIREALAAHEKLFKELELSK